MASYKGNKKLIGVVYLHSIHPPRVGNSLPRVIEKCRKAFGDAAAKSFVIVTTHWDLVKDKAGETRYNQLARTPNYFGTLLKHHATMRRYKEGDDPLAIIKSIIQVNQHITLPIAEDPFVELGPDERYIL